MITKWLFRHVWTLDELVRPLSGCLDGGADPPGPAAVTEQDTDILVCLRGMNMAGDCAVL